MNLIFQVAKIQNCILICQLPSYCLRFISIFDSYNPINYLHDCQFTPHFFISPLFLNWYSHRVDSSSSFNSIYFYLIIILFTVEAVTVTTYPKRHSPIVQTGYIILCCVQQDKPESLKLRLIFFLDLSKTWC